MLFHVSDEGSLEDYPGYTFYKNGEIWSSKRRHFCEIFGTPTHDGYLRIMLTNRFGVRIERPVHQFICEAFHGPCPDGLECGHKDGNQLNNHVDNLKWCTHLENIKDKFLHGTIRYGEEHHRSVMTDEVRLQIFEALDMMLPGALIMEKFGIKKGTLANFRFGRVKRPARPNQ